MKLSNCKAYEVLEERKIEDLNSTGALLRHKKTGAKVVLLLNNDPNKVFYIGFRTTPDNSTGVAHIMEHTVLCGSRKFPVKDPFVELVKGSLNTFLNAMTYPDKTVYPVASCNDTDFKNLMDVYLDAVFYPNIFKNKKIFMQEGWHYELEDENEPVKINGVVYNEMKGAFSSPDDILDRAVLGTLFPETTYANESGGDPDDIPKLTYEEYLEFHKKYYHPSNSYIYLYGDMDMEERLDWMDREYLSQFEYEDVHSEIEPQKPFAKPIEVTKEYSITTDEPEEDHTYLAYNTVIGNVLDPEKYIAFQVLDYALCSAPGAPLKQRLTDLGIGTEIYSVYDNGVYQPYFSIVAKNTNADRKEEFVQTVETVLREQIEQGIDRNSLLAGLNYFEFKYREADYGSYPKGLMLGLQLLDSWNYDANSPFMHIECNKTFALLKERVESRYYEKLVETYLLNNPHKSVVMVLPKRGLNVEKDKELKESLEAYKQMLTKKQIKDLVAETKALKEYQESEDAPEDLAKIPMLKREDMKKEAMPFNNELLEKDGTKILFHDIFTNGVSYTRLIFPITDISEEWLFYLGILKNVWGLMDTKEHKYGAFFHEIHKNTGGIAPVVNSYTDAKDTTRFRLHVECKAKTLYGQTDKALKLMGEMLLETVFTDRKRLLEILEETKSRAESSLQSSGHAAAQLRAASGFSRTAYIEENLHGITFYKRLSALIENFNSEAENLIVKLQELVQIICRPEEFMVDYTGTKEGLDELTALIPAWKKRLFTTPCDKKGMKIALHPVKEGFITSGQVQFVCRCGNFKAAGLPYHGALRVLKVMMGYDYLWIQVRVKGGAYGCMSSFGKTGESYFVSYRDPNLAETLNIYEKASDYVRSFEADERTMTKYIIGAISEKDMPLSPSAQGIRSMTAYFANYDFEEEQKERDELLGADEQVIRSLAAYIDAFMASGQLCVIGSEEKMQEQRELFDHMENLLS